MISPCHQLLGLTFCSALRLQTLFLIFPVDPVGVHLCLLHGLDCCFLNKKSSKKSVHRVSVLIEIIITFCFLSAKVNSGT